MAAEYFFINYSGNRQTIEAICERFPQLDIVPSFTFIVETVDSINACTLVISS